MEVGKFDQWAKQLLDTGKNRNNLVNFKDTKTSTLDVLLPSCEDIFQKFSSENSGSFKIFNPEEEFNKKHNDKYYVDNLDTDDFHEIEYADGNPRKKYESKTDFKNNYSNKIKANQILAYSSSGKPLEAARNIMRKSREIIEETGVNVAFITFGLIHWKEANYADTIYNAPILLIPVQLSSESIGRSYKISVLDNDVIVNRAFSYKLDNEYGITLPNYDSETTLGEYFENVQNMVSKLGWVISKECKIGLFSFAKINMYVDLKENKNDILNSPTVRQLFGEVVDSGNSYLDSEDIDKSDYDSIIDLCNVVDADSSQIEAIEMAKSGKSFVLQGPPGTGKSQTITNIIAECLNDGKKVLFVSEKLAALNVVYNKMKQVGLADFCLQLHSNKANKKSVIEDICRNLNIKKDVVSNIKFDEEIKAKKNVKEKLDSYERTLHEVQPVINKSLYDLYESLAKWDYAPEFICPTEDISKLGSEYLDRSTDLLRSYVDYSYYIGYDYRKNPWYGYINQDNSIAEEVRLKGSISSAVDTLNDLIPLLDRISEQYGVRCESLKDALFWGKFFDFVANSALVTPSILKRQNFDIAYNALENLESMSNKIHALMQKLSDCNEDIYYLDGLDNYNNLRQFRSVLSRIFNSEYKKIVYDIRSCKKVNKKPNYKESILLMELLAKYQKSISEYSDAEASIKSLLGSAYKGIDTDWNYVSSQMRILKNMLDSGYSFESLERYSSFASESKIFVEYSHQINNILNENSIKNIDYVSGCFDKNIVDFNAIDAVKVQSRLHKCIESSDTLQKWCTFRDILARLEKNGLIPFIHELIKNNVSKDNIVPTFNKQFYLQWIDFVILKSPILSQFNRATQDRFIKDFIEKDLEEFDINRKRLRAKLANACPVRECAVAGSQLSELLYENQKSRNKKNIRLLLSETKDAVQIVKPCFMMSPLSVSTFLNYKDLKFDVVIFDEASQVFPWDAVGAISRAKQAIIVGDSKQMPPSNFFATSVNNDDDIDDYDDIRSFDSILDFASSTMPQLRLNWHYRSRSEQLIAFSNKNFYNGSLISFPAAKDNSEGMGVDYYYVNGVFNRSYHDNRKEAEYVVDLIYKNIEKYPNRSLGVVAFSQSQQNLIDNLLFKRRQITPEKEFFFDSGKEEPFFIKNLETVQGDERDAIIFSIGYGPDSNGMFSTNFGPLNRDGGQKRLNVAVTRAKYNIQVVSSMHATDIDLSHSESDGARLLREYLDFAENGEIALQRSESVASYDQFDSDFEVEVCEFLRNHGYSVDTQVGCSGFRIDLGVKVPNSSDYLLAVECDGATYHSSKNARDRDRLRQTILENMGWKFYRIWSTEWFRNKISEQDKLLGFVRKAVDNYKNHKDDYAENLEDRLPVSSSFLSETEADLCGKSLYNAEFSEESTNSILNDIPFSFVKYKMADTNKDCKNIFSKYNNADFKSSVKDILEVESPLSENLLLQRILWYFEREKVTSSVQKRFDIKMRGCEYFGIVRENGFMYLKDKPITFRLPGDIVRDFKQIAPEELGVGMMEIISKNVVLAKEGLYRFMLGLYGKKRIGKLDGEALDNALSMLLQSEKIVETDGQISLK